MRRGARSSSAPAKEAPASTAETANAISATTVRCTASGYAEHDEREGQRDDSGRERLQRAFRREAQALRSERLGRSVDALHGPGHPADSSSDVAHRGRKRSLRRAEERGEQGGEDGFSANRAC